jgi:hypothetical protein
MTPGTSGGQLRVSKEHVLDYRKLGVIFMIHNDCDSTLPTLDCSSEGLNKQRNPFKNKCLRF